MFCAKTGYGLDRLVHDKDDDVREEVARQGYGHDILFKDKNVNVRAEVARQGHYCDVLINDENAWVAYQAETALEESKNKQ